MFMYLEFMKNYLFLIIIFLFISNCTLNKVVKHHGVHFLEKKYNKISTESANKNDIIQLLGPPSTNSDFNKNLWIYIERSTSSSKVSKLGKKELLTSTIVVLEFDNRGLLKDKTLITKNNLNDINFTKQITALSLSEQSTLYNMLSGMKNRVNDPLGKKRKRVED